MHLDSLVARRPLTGIDLLRVATCLAIAAYHATATGIADGTRWMGWVSGPRVLAPALTGLFLALSGFVLYHASIGARGELRANAPAFWRARAARLVPLMLLSHLLVAPLALLGASHYGAREAAVRGLLVATATQAWVPSLYASYNTPAWTLSVLALGYLLFPWAARWVARAPLARVRPLLVALWAASLLLTVPAVMVPSTSVVLQRLGIGDTLLHVFPPVRVLEFLGGVCLARLWSDREAVRTRPPLALLGGGAVAALLLVAGDAGLVPERVIGSGGVAPLWWCVIWAAAEVRAARGAALVRELGRASLGVYLLHEPLLAWLNIPIYRGWLAGWEGVALAAWLLLLVPVGVAAERRFVAPVARRLTRRGCPAERGATIPRADTTDAARESEVEASAPGVLA